MSKLLEKLQKNCTIKEADVLEHSIYYNEKEQISTPVPMVNVALSGRLDGGLQSGLTMLAGDSRTFKCFDGTTPINIRKSSDTIFVMTHNELFELMSKCPDVEIYVQNHFGDWVPILACIKKQAKTCTITFQQEYGDRPDSYIQEHQLTCAIDHPFMSEAGLPVLAKDLELFQRVVSTSEEAGAATSVIAIDEHPGEREVIGIAIDSPHWYVHDLEHKIVSHNTNFSLLMAASYMAHHKDAIMIFYDSEFGSPQSYFTAFGIDTSRVLHVPIKSIEDFKFDIIPQLENITRKDNVVIVVDSIGNLASKKEIDDAMAQNTAADMTRAKQLKSCFRMITPYLNMKDVPMIVINHVYKSQSFIPVDIVSGGTGIFLSSDNIIKVGRRQQKTGTEVTGYEFILNIEKSRFTKEKAKIPITVSWEGGIEKWSGLTEVALLGGYVKKPKNGWYIAVNPATGQELSKSVRMKDTLKKDFWEPILEQTDFADFIERSYKIPETNMLSEDGAGEDSPILEIAD